MGGHSAGDVAAATAVDALAAFFRTFHADPRQVWPYPVDRSMSLGANLLRVGIKVANDKVRAAAAGDRSRARMACDDRGDGDRATARSRSPTPATAAPTASAAIGSSA